MPITKLQVRVITGIVAALVVVTNGGNVEVRIQEDAPAQSPGSNFRRLPGGSSGSVMKKAPERSAPC